MARPKKPELEKELTGAYKKNPQRRPPNTPPATFDLSANTVVSATGPGAPPEHLNAAERSAWFEIVNATFPGVVGISDRIALEIMAKLLVESRTEFLLMQGARLSRLETLLARFGMTPADRQRINIGPQKPKNKFADLDS